MFASRVAGRAKVRWWNMTRETRRPAAIGIGGIAAEVTKRCSARVSLGIVLAFALAATFCATSYTVRSRNDTLEHQRESVEAVLGVLPPDTEILAVEAPQPLVLAGKRNPTRFHLYGNGLFDYLEDVWPEGSEGFVAWIGDRESPLIAVGPRRAPLWLKPLLDDEYKRLGRVPKWTWFARRDLGKAKLSELRDSLAQQSWRVEG